MIHSEETNNGWKLHVFKSLTKFLAFITIITSFSLASSIRVFADDDSGEDKIVEVVKDKEEEKKVKQQLKSLKANLINPVFQVELSEGTIINTDGEREKRKKINDEIILNNGKKTYSLYDRFGGNIQFVPYFGEAKIKTTLVDKIYTYLEDNDYNFEIKSKEIVDLIKKPQAYSNNIMYVGRPDVLTADDIVQGGKKDPRVSAWSPSNTSGLSAGIGNMNLTISEFITYFTAWLSGNKMYNTMENLWLKAWKSDIGILVLTIFRIIFPMLGLTLLFGIVKRGIQFAKGKTSFRGVIGYFITGIITAGVITSFAADPNKFLSISTQVATFADEQFDKGLAINGSPIVKSDDTSNVRMASLWEETVFYPWVQGTFGTTYESLNQPDLKKSSKGLKLEGDKLEGKWEGTRYNNLEVLGQPRVNLGQGKYIDNWAAFAWSTQSIYHISPNNYNDVKDVNEGQPDNRTEEQKKKDQSAKDNYDKAGVTSYNNKKITDVSWPIAPTTPMNDQIYLDSFRWIDAKLNVAQGYNGSYDEKNKTDNYNTGRAYTEDFIKQGFNALFASLMLLPIAIMGFKKCKQSVLVLAGGVIFLYNCCKWFFVPTGYGLGSNFKRLAASTGWYLWYSLITYMMITIYKLTAHGNALALLIWITISLYLLFLQPPESFGDVKKRFNNFRLKLMNSNPVKAIRSEVKDSSLVKKLAKDEIRDEHKRKDNQLKEEARANSGTKREARIKLNAMRKEVKRTNLQNGVSDRQKRKDLQRQFFKDEADRKRQLQSRNDRYNRPDLEDKTTKDP